MELTVISEKFIGAVEGVKFKTEVAEFDKPGLVN